MGKEVGLVVPGPASPEAHAHPLDKYLSCAEDRPCGEQGASHRVLITRQTSLFQDGPFWVAVCILPGEEHVLTVPSD